MEATVAIERIEPDLAPVLALLGVPGSDRLHADVRELIEQSYALFSDLAVGRGLTETIERESFAVLYRGAGQNDPDTPLEHIFPGAEALALYAVTIGAAISDEITGLFDRGEYAAGSVLDAVASAGTERLAEVVQTDWLEQQGLGGTPTAARASLRYSPGYCGWHVSGQRALFDALEPERIGIELSESSLMQPIKSTTGVIVTGARELHVFDPVFPCCAACACPTCRERIRDLFAPENDSPS